MSISTASCTKGEFGELAIEFITTFVDVPPGTGRRQLNGSVNLADKFVRSANVALAGFTLDFANSDHHINVVEVATQFAGFRGQIVNFRVTCQYADKNFDDTYSGRIFVLVIVETQP
jgi:hypothetical protein